jgi:hypothetical protein
MNWKIRTSIVCAAVLLTTHSVTAADAQTTATVESTEARAIAKGGLYLRLPLVMRYGKIHAFCVNKNHWQYKAPVNWLLNTARVSYRTIRRL